MSFKRLAMFAVVISLFVFATAVSALTAGNVDGVWGSPTPSNTSSFRWCYAPDNTAGPAGAPTACSSSSAGIQNPPGSTTTDENQWRYGTPAGTVTNANRSGYGFNGNNNVGSVAADVPFYLGRFTHYNNPITADNILTQIGLSVTMDGLLCDDGSVPTQGGSQNFNFTFTHDETPNGANPCPYGNSTGVGCDDRVTTNAQSDTSFTCPEGERTLQILGFVPGPGCDVAYTPPTVNSFITGEGQANPACLWARISAPGSLAVSLESFSAAWTGGHVLVTWETASEIGNRGFNLYRGTAPLHMDEKLNETLIPSQSPGNAQGFAYTFEDAASTPGVEYWYWLEDVATNGIGVFHGPVGPTGVVSFHARLEAPLPDCAVSLEVSSSGGGEMTLKRDGLTIQTWPASSAPLSVVYLDNPDPWPGTVQVHNYEVSQDGSILIDSVDCAPAPTAVRGTTFTAASVAVVNGSCKLTGNGRNVACVCRVGNRWRGAPMFICRQA